MKAFDAIKEAAHREGVPLSTISDKLGIGNGISSGASRGSSPRCDTAARMLGAVGWRLVAVPESDVPERGVEVE